jgi:hypothetical protein
MIVQGASTYEIPEAWFTRKEFPIEQYDEACAYAMELSMAKMPPSDQLAVFEDGKPAEIAQTSPQA